MSIEYLEDPKLLFGDDNPAFDPCHGLTEFGPYGIKKFKTIKLGIVGSSDSITSLETFLKRIENKITHKNSLKWPFPGLHDDSSNLKFDLEVISTEPIENDELHIFKEMDPNSRLERAEIALNLFEEKINKLTGPDRTPDVILASIPVEILKSCRDPNSKFTNKITLNNRQFNFTDPEEISKGYNFHNILKVIGMEKGKPTQLIFPRTLKLNPSAYGRQDLATIAWNFSVALLYKANEQPWKYFEFPTDTCFIGISFHKELDNNLEQVQRASVAQTFLSDGRNIILRGEKFDWNEKFNKNPHMTKEYSYTLVNRVLKEFEKYWGHYPNRVVIHKTSEYWDSELRGINEALNNVKKIDLLTITNTFMQFFRIGQETLVRGSYISFLGKHFLYNVGYIPCLNEYPGAKIPNPIEIKFSQSSVSKRNNLKEIMALGRLNWNNIDYSTREPVTLTFSKNVGKILSEFRARNFDKPPDKYRFYM